MNTKSAALQFQGHIDIFHDTLESVVSQSKGPDFRFTFWGGRGGGSISGDINANTLKKKERKEKWRLLATRLGLLLTRVPSA